MRGDTQSQRVKEPRAKAKHRGIISEISHHHKLKPQLEIVDKGDPI